MISGGVALARASAPLILGRRGDFEARVAAWKAAATESRRCLELVVARGSQPDAAGRSGGRMRCGSDGRESRDWLPTAAGPAGSGRRCEVWCGAAAG